MSKLSIPVSERDHVQGPSQAPVTLLEYGDYECPHCGRAYPIIKAVQKKLGSKLRFVFRNFPLAQIHPHAELAAEAAEAAGAQDKFWEMHDALYEGQKRLNPEFVLAQSELLRLDMEGFAEELKNRTYLPRVKEDFKSGVRSGVNGTPTFFINGIRWDGSWDEDTLVEILTKAAEQAGYQERS